MKTEERKGGGGEEARIRRGEKREGMRKGGREEGEEEEEEEEEEKEEEEEREGGRENREGKWEVGRTIKSMLLGTVLCPVIPVETYHRNFTC